jgi:hypothetical protein
MTRLRVPARDLRPGDYTLGSKLTVLRVDAASQKGSVLLRLRREDGTERHVSWRRSTVIEIERGGCQCGCQVHGDAAPATCVFERTDGSTL